MRQLHTAFICLNPYSLSLLLAERLSLLSPPVDWSVNLAGIAPLVTDTQRENNVTLEVIHTLVTRSQRGAGPAAGERREERTHYVTE